MRECVCSSGQPLESCCGPYLDGAEAPDASRLMRSRYAAFVLTTQRSADEKALRDKAYVYLQKTLHSSQPEAKIALSQYRALLEKNGKTARYRGLDILDADGPDAQGVHRVLFRVQMYNAGKDASFVELSSFASENGGLRYVAGALMPANSFKELNVSTIAEVVKLMQEG